MKTIFLFGLLLTVNAHATQVIPGIGSGKASLTISEAYKEATKLSQDAAVGNAKEICKRPVKRLEEFRVSYQKVGTYIIATSSSEFSCHLGRLFI